MTTQLKVSQNFPFARSECHWLKWVVVRGWAMCPVVAPFMLYSACRSEILSERFRYLFQVVCRTKAPRLAVLISSGFLWLVSSAITVTTFANTHTTKQEGRNWYQHAFTLCLLHPAAENKFKLEGGSLSAFVLLLSRQTDYSMNNNFIHQTL